MITYESFPRVPAKIVFDNTEENVIVASIRQTEEDYPYENSGHGIITETITYICEKEITRYY